MSLFRLYRIQVFQEQQDLLEPYPGGNKVLEEILSSRHLQKSLKTKRYFTVGIHSIDKTSVSFKFVRTRNIKTIEFEDEEPIEQTHEDNPYVNVIIDHDLEICAISKNTKFFSDIDTCAQKLQMVLNESHVTKRYCCEVFIDPIRDPTTFLDFLDKASIVQKFYFKTRRPNVLDGSLFVKPLKQLTLEANATKSRTSIEGSNINREIAKEISRTVASTGDDAGARIRMPHSKSFVTKSLGKRCVDFEWPKNIDKTAKEFIRVVREKYEDIRKSTKH